MPKGIGELLLGAGPASGPGEEKMDTKGVAAKDILAAVKGNDETALQGALQRFYDACSAEDIEDMED